MLPSTVLFIDYIAVACLFNFMIALLNKKTLSLVVTEGALNTTRIMTAGTGGALRRPSYFSNRAIAGTHHARKFQDEKEVKG